MNLKWEDVYDSYNNEESYADISKIDIEPELILLHNNGSILIDSTILPVRKRQLEDEVLEKEREFASSIYKNRY